MKNIKPVMLYSLPKDTKLITDLAKTDQKYMVSFGLAVQSIKLNPKYRNIKLQKRKILCLKNDMAEAFLTKFMFKRDIKINLINYGIVNYFKNKSILLKPIETFESIMKDLDLLINNKIPCINNRLNNIDNFNLELDKIINPIKVVDIVSTDIIDIPKKCRCPKNSVFCFCYDEQGNFIK